MAHEGQLLWTARASEWMSILIKLPSKINFPINGSSGKNYPSIDLFFISWKATPCARQFERFFNKISIKSFVLMANEKQIKICIRHCTWIRKILLPSDSCCIAWVMARTAGHLLNFLLSHFTREANFEDIPWILNEWVAALIPQQVSLAPFVAQ